MASAALKRHDEFPNLLLPPTFLWLELFDFLGGRNLSGVDELYLLSWEMVCNILQPALSERARNHCWRSRGGTRMGPELSL